MFTISILGQKGGTGKTTVALGLAVAAFRAGKVVAVVDLDPQASAANRIRSAEAGTRISPAVPPAPVTVSTRSPVASANALRA